MILYVINGYSGYSGAAKQAVLQSTSLDKNKVFFLTVGGRVKGLENSVVFNNTIRSCADFIFLLFRYKVSLVHFHGFFFLPILLCFFTRKRYFIKTTLLGSDDVDSLKCSKLGRVKLFLLKKANKNIVLTREMKKISYSNGFTNSVLLPNAVFVPEVNLNLKEKIFIIVGLVCERKSTLEGILFFKDKVLQVIPDAKLYIIGPTDGEGIPEFSPGYYNECVKHADNNIVFTGNLSSENLAKYYAVATSIIFLSKKEGMPNALLEAMSYGCIPIINLDCDGSKEVVKEDALRFSTEEDLGVLAGLFKSTKYNSLCKDYIERNFSTNVILPKLKELYENC
ncbi:glycosyltransferase family 4 protein [Shewanella algae]|uniref:glycosyltransferase family 4 protein n=1 Tax=Shewanella algae TaxID=38313 RepID=UPI001641EEC0|nr:glycosyltransferase family 4 protein [Shewanella algae]QNH98438.1 glycosyltransferase family 4 protein [Shewanella algae]